MLKKYYIIILLMFFSCMGSADASLHKTLDDLLASESARLTIRPLKLAEFDAALALDKTDQRFVSIIEEEEGVPASTKDSLKKADNLLKADGATDVVDALYQLPSGVLYLGAYTKGEASRLVGILKLSGFYKHDESDEKKNKGFLGTDVKFHKDTQGQGYASEVYETLFKHLAHLKIIPSLEDAEEEAVFSGVHALIHLTNKASLKCLVVNCRSAIGKLFGNRVDVYYPKPVVRTDVVEFPPFGPDTLDQEVRPVLEQYLSRDKDISEPAEKVLYQKALQGLMNVEETRIEEAVNDESAFIMAAIGKYPEFFKGLPKSFHDPLKKNIKEIEKDMPSIDEVPEPFKEQFNLIKKSISEFKKFLPFEENETEKEENVQVEDSSGKLEMNAAVDALSAPAEDNLTPNKTEADDPINKELEKKASGSEIPKI
ncbi:MAG: hypothetical protein ACTHJ4_08880 [Candidatus Nucleicultricaceae bacterium]